VLEPARKFGNPLADLVQPMPHSVRNTLMDEPGAIHGIERYWKSGFTDTISDELIDVAVDAASNFSSPLTQIVFFQIHGAATRVPSSETAFGLRGQKWDVNVLSQWTEAGESEHHTAWTRQVWGKFEPLISGTAYVNHIAGDDKPEKVRASYGENYEKLVALKDKYDPTNMFRLNANIKPKG